MRAFPLALYFAAYGIVLATVLALLWMVQLDLGTQGRWSHPIVVWLLLDFVSLPVALLLTIREAKRRKCPDADEIRYRTALRVGEPIGDVSRWPASIRRDRTEARALAALNVLGVGWWGVHAYLYEPWWAGTIMVVLPDGGCGSRGGFCAT
jgi:hypothetical protein